jgi:hypothetical protein
MPPDGDWVGEAYVQTVIDAIAFAGRGANRHSRSVPIYARELHRLGSLFGIVGHELAEVGGW